MMKHFGAVSIEIWVVTIDVINLYTAIDHMQGIIEVRKIFWPLICLEKNTDSIPHFESGCPFSIQRPSINPNINGSDQ